MDIKTKLEDVDFLFSVSEHSDKIACTNILKYLNGKGIFTVEKLINCQESDFPTSSRKSYMAIIQILKHEFLGQDLINDVLLEKTYTNNSLGIKECAKDYAKLGFSISQSTYSSKLVATTDKIKRYFARTGFVDETFSMEYIIKELPILRKGGPKLAEYYLQYINEMKEKNQELATEKLSPSVIEGLKTQLQGLVTMRNGLDMQIAALQEQINQNSKEGTKSHGRK